jgi:hypothetical protein
MIYNYFLSFDNLLTHADYAFFVYITVYSLKMA